MPKDSLIHTNSYLRDSKRRGALLAKTVVSSTAIEGVHLDWDELEKLQSILPKISLNLSPSPTLPSF